ncbi:MAG: penicillin-binding protein 1C [Bacteroidales bacterium]|nr:penicillin-binding protein 1C [Bacteroidales bacterium]
MKTKSKKKISLTTIPDKPKIVLFTSITIWAILIIAYIFCLPSPLFNNPYSTVVLDKNDLLIGVKIADDGQWRFPETTEVSDKFEKCILTFEDKRFYYHPGFDPISIGRAIRQNIISGEIVSGGSTITMQTVRLSRKGKSRNFYEKLVELILATRLELQFSKKEILCIYASHAPFGGNIVGIEAAAWRYFGRDPNQLSWAENAMLAVLPNSPSMIHTAKNRDLLKQKRNKLLKDLQLLGYLSETELELALEEPIPDHPQPYPMHAYHLTERAANECSNDEFVKTTIDLNLQKRANEIVFQFNKRYSQNEINNIACLILEVETGNIKVYIGNADISSDNPEKAVDMITANRSTGSILKPFLYAAMLSSGEILPKTILKDIPTKMGSFSPENFNREFDGAVPADEALARSLNIPFVYLLKEYGIMRFQYILKSLQLNTINKSSEHYGLSLILGGAESSLWDICSAYASMARSLKHFTISNSRYLTGDYHKAKYTFANDSKETSREKETSFLSAASIWLSFEAMTSVNRPGQERMWRKFTSRQKVAWKTGTSFGFKDAWSIAITPDYVVGIWVGNASGEGRAGITGLNVAAPVLFEILNILPDYTRWFEQPFDDMVQAEICSRSGQIAGPDCPEKDTLWIPTCGVNSEMCEYHKTIHLDQTGNYRVNSDCYPIDQMISQSWFVLPPIMEAYYKQRNPWYLSLPPYLESCSDHNMQSTNVMELIYPSQLSRVHIPIELTGDTLPAVFKLAHRDENAKIYWYIDTKYIGQTQDYHEMPIKLTSGDYTLNIMDNKGNKISKRFIVVDRD